MMDMFDSGESYTPMMMAEDTNADNGYDPYLAANSDDVEDYTVIRGTPENDELEGNFHDTLLGLGGNDTLTTADGEGFNVLKGGTGRDFLQGGHDDTLFGGKGSDYLEMHGGNNVLFGGSGADTFELADCDELPDIANIVKDFQFNKDTLLIRNIEGLDSFDDLTLIQDGDDVLIAFEDTELAVIENTALSKVNENNVTIDPVYTTDISAEDFDGSPVDNPYFPLTPGTRWVYEGETEEGLERTVVEVLSETRIIEGITATIVHDTVFLDGELIEDTLDFFAQDIEGNVWYLGEETTEFEDGVPVGTEGSWLFGVDGGLPGIVMFADPTAHIGETYNQEFLMCEAEDRATLLSASKTVKIPEFGTFTDVVKTFDFTPLEPISALENKFYAAGIGLIKEVDRVTGDVSVLVEFTRPTAA